MEYIKKLDEFGDAPSDVEIDDIVRQAEMNAVDNRNVECYKVCFSCLDLTTLDIADSDQTVIEFVSKTMELSTKFQDILMPASLCVYPNYVDVVGLAIGDSGIKITSVAGGFPTGQTYLEVKMLEAAMAVENGADEIDIVLNIGEIMAGEYDIAANEIEIIRQEIGEDVTLKVIIEAGILPSSVHIRTASLLSMLAGAHFVKTSTGKADVSATAQSAVVMCMAIREFYERTGRKIGLKVAGGVRKAEDAAMYYTIVENILGQEWLTPALFRIGASFLANDLLTKIKGYNVTHF